MERWTMETATAVTAAPDALPCQLCEWHVHSKQQHSKFKPKNKAPRSPTSLQNYLNSWHQMKEKQCEEEDNK